MLLAELYTASEKSESLPSLLTKSESEEWSDLLRLMSEKGVELHSSASHFFTPLPPRRHGILQGWEVSLKSKNSSKYVSFKKELGSKNVFCVNGYILCSII